MFSWYHWLIVAVPVLAVCALAVRTDNITFYVVYLRPFSTLGVKQHTNLLARLERILLNTLTVTAQLGIRLSVAQRLNGSH